MCDVGSGAGLPGLVLAIVRLDLRVTLLEPLLRRTTFLQETVEDLGLSNVEVVRGRAESLHGLRTFDVVTSRAVAPLARLLEWSMPLVQPDGAMIALKGSSVEQEIADARDTLRRLGCRSPEVTSVGSTADIPTRVVRVSWTGEAALRLRSAARDGAARDGGGARGRASSARGAKSRPRRRS
mgnify:CR=1 FL=1